MSVREAWEWFDWNMFLFFMKSTEEELEQLPLKLVCVCKRCYDALMMLFMFWSFTFAFALMYENMAMASAGIIPPNIIQQMPIIIWVMMVGFTLFAGEWIDKNAVTWGA